VNKSNFTTLETNGDMLSDTFLLLLLPLGEGLLDFRSILLGFDLVGPCFSIAALRDDSCVGARAPAQLTPLAGTKSNVEYQSTYGDHVQGQAISSPSGPGSENTRINGTSHALPKILRNTRHITLNNVASSHTFRGQNVAQLLGFLAAHKRDMGTSPRVVFNAFYQMRPGSSSCKVDNSNAAFVTTTTVPNGDPTRVVSTTLALASFGKCQLVHRSSFPQMVIDWPSQMSDTGSPWLVLSQENASIVTGWWRGKGDAWIESGAG
jgi:hypothetical protein